MFTGNECSIPLGIANFFLKNQWIKNQFHQVRKLTVKITGNECKISQTKLSLPGLNGLGANVAGYASSPPWVLGGMVAGSRLLYIDP